MFPIHDENRPSRTPYVNYGLLIVNIIVFFYFFLQGTPQLWSAIMSLGTKPSDIIAGKKLWTLFTSMFMHADIMHLFGNMIYLWVFGDNIEDALGHIKYTIFYFLGGLVATFTHIGSVYVTLPSLGEVGLGIPSVGASGAISAILGAYLMLYPRAKIRTLTFYFFITIVTIPAYYYLGFWFIYQLMMGFFSLTGLPSGVAFWAHIGGFAAGSLIMWVLRTATGSSLKSGRIFRKKPVRPLVVSPRVRRPFVDLMTEGDRLRVLAELPGVRQEDIEIKVSETDVIISAVHEDTNYYRRIRLPTLVVPQVRNLSYNNGVLSFSLRIAL